MILLNPGPVNVSERVRQALLRPDICHRESEFTELLLRIQDKLLKAFVPGAEADYAAVLITGSGTAAVESALMSAIPHGKRVLVLNNGVYGERLSQMVGLHRLGVSELKYDWTARPDPERLRLALRQHPVADEARADADQRGDHGQRGQDGGATDFINRSGNNR